MRAVLQRVTSAHVSVEGSKISSIDSGILALIGVATGDTSEDAERLAKKTIELRIFSNEDGKFDKSLQEIGGAVLAVSQFTLLGDARKGRRPSFAKASDTNTARSLFEEYVSSIRRLGTEVLMGQFQANMQVSLTNDGPVTILLDSKKEF